MDLPAITMKSAGWPTKTCANSSSLSPVIQSSRLRSSEPETGKRSWKRRWLVDGGDACWQGSYLVRREVESTLRSQAQHNSPRAVLAIPSRFFLLFFPYSSYRARLSEHERCYSRSRIASVIYCKGPPGGPELVYANEGSYTWRQPRLGPVAFLRACGVAVGAMTALSCDTAEDSSMGSSEMCQKPRS
jgi:hypothetical protein